jgi:hypothetical protein
MERIDHDLDPDGDLIIVLRGSPASLSYQTQDNPMRLRVSSKHVALASHSLKNQLPAESLSGETTSESLPQLQLVHGEPWSLLILLNIIHGKSYAVPRRLCLSELTELAIQVQYYRLEEVVGAFADHWYANLTEDVPSDMGEDLLKWMCISQAFDWKEIWDKVTVTA